MKNKNLMKKTKSVHMRDLRYLYRLLGLNKSSSEYTLHNNSLITHIVKFISAFQNYNNINIIGIYLYSIYQVVIEIVNKQYKEINVSR
jgi:hypothetical protein